MQDVMVDLETLGTTPGSVVLSIGAVAFNPITGELGPEFYSVISMESSVAAGLKSDPMTLNWWMNQSAEARDALSCALTAGDKLEDSLHQFTAYLGQFGHATVRVWGNGADFDNALLASCYEAAGQSVPWRFWNNRCYRTVKNMPAYAGPKLERVGTYHNALDDAKSQALHLIKLLKLQKG